MKSRHIEKAPEPVSAANAGRKEFGFEIKKNFFKDANERILSNFQPELWRI